MIVIRGGLVYDPAHGLEGNVQDVWVEGDRIIPAPEHPGRVQVMDARGMIIAPAGVEIHSHVAGYALNAARTFLQAEPDLQDLLLPSSKEAAERYLQLGYTTVFDAAMSPLFAQSSHADLAQMQLMDRGAYTLMGDNLLLLKALAGGSRAEIRDTIAWLLQVSGGYAVKLVNPGGGIAWKRGQPAPSLDESIGMGDVTQRKIIQTVVDIVNEMKLPHPVHLHAGRLGQPGSWKSFCETVRALEGQRAHLCHIQFYAYGDDGHGGYTSAADKVVKCLQPYKRISMDIGQALFGSAMATTADTSALSFLRAMTKRQWISRQVEGEGGNSVMPLAYLACDPSSAVQWATGLELLLRFPDPQRMFLTCDHPNGGPFSAYPQIIEWLMSKPARCEMLGKIHRAAREKTGLGEIDREVTLSEIVAMTSTGPARALGLVDHGHLGVGALADIRCYQQSADIQAMFANPAWVMRRGCIAVKQGKVVEGAANGSTLVVRPEWDKEKLSSIHRKLSTLVSVQPEHFGLGRDGPTQEFQEVPCASKVS